MTTTVPLETSGADRAGRARRRVLVVRAPDRAAPLLALLDESGIDAAAAPVVERTPVEDPAELDRARAALARGEYAWVAVTSVNAVEALCGAAPPRPRAPDWLVEGTRWACVGPATRRALEAHAIGVDLVPGTMTAAGLVAAFPEAGSAGTPAEAGRRVLAPLGDLAADTLPDGLRAKGWLPRVVTAYHTVARELPRDVVDRAGAAGYDAVVVASGSAARQVAEQLGPQRVVAIGEPSARAARDAGHDVLAVAAAPTDGALATAVRDVLGRPA
ncbi:uroporphyrinogen-III synthase [Myceligenerans xiligouense]|uniref:Uroporphyrinogen-III synthase n=1 Tax=Myceligenerans xiligouense TaxID=253184 RepID=A0A3N4ZCS5_9MICO|nr:uroporphyrinogen-III synthase [Myceligenerans xiligouense]RPF23272.1 uroporphyrinogen-III synthase [Myceligenerans xiligouense]